MRTRVNLCVLLACLFLSFSHLAGAGERVVALTFDDGPDPVQTPKLLDTLRREGVCATFFIVGERALKYPHIVKDIDDECHAIGNHSMSHPHKVIAKMSVEQIKAEFAGAAGAIAAATDKVPWFVRVPGCTDTPEIRSALVGYLVVRCEIDPRDWSHDARSAADIAEYVVKHAEPRKHVVLHDTRDRTVDAVPAMIAGLKALSYEFVTIPQLYGLEYVAPKQSAKK